LNFSLGSGGVGKSAITIRLVTDNFLEDYDPTIEDSYRKPLVVDDKPIVLDIVDTAGQEDYSGMQDQVFCRFLCFVLTLLKWMRDGKGFLLVYSIIDRSSFDHLIDLRSKILKSTETKGVIPL
jgi:GTPase KRas